MNNKPLKTRSSALAGVLAALLAGVGLLLSGCGLNDNPGGLAINANVQYDPQAVSMMASQGGSQPFGIPSLEVGGLKIYTVIVGAVIIRHTNIPYTSASTITEAQRELLVDDGEQSIDFLKIVQLPTVENTITFDFPAEDGLNWQLIAVGMREPISQYSEITSYSPAYYGFTPYFIQNAVPGQVFDLTMEPGCGLTDYPLGAPPC